MSGALVPFFHDVCSDACLPEAGGFELSLMYDVKDDAKGGFRRIELLTGPGRRRRWSAEEKARVIQETLEPGARVSEVARRWQVCRNCSPL